MLIVQCAETSLVYYLVDYTLNVFFRFPALASQYPSVLSAEQVRMVGEFGDQCNSRIACEAEQAPASTCQYGRNGVWTLLQRDS